MPRKIKFLIFHPKQLSIGVAVLCLPWLRWAQPNLPRPIRVPLVFPIVYLIATVFVTAVPMYASPVETGYGILMILSSVPVYLVFIAWKNKPIWFQKSMGKCWSYFYLNNVTCRNRSAKCRVCFTTEKSDQCAEYRSDQMICCKFVYKFFQL